MSVNQKTDRKMTKRTENATPIDFVINHDLDAIDEDFLNPMEVKRRAIADANASFEKFARELA